MRKARGFSAEVTKQKEGGNMGRVGRKLPMLAVLLIGAAFSVEPAASQETAYPTKTIKVIIPNPPGGGTDAAALLITDKLSRKLGQPIVKESRPGSATVLGTAALANSAPDGHTLLIVAAGIANNPFLYSNLPYKTPESFNVVSILTSYPFAFAVRADLPFKTMKELVDFAKANPGKLTGGTPGRGSSAQLALGLLKNVAGIDIREIPFKGSGESLQAVAGGFVDVVFSGYETVRPFLESKKMRILAHSGTDVMGTEQIQPIVKDVPGYEFLNWIALVAPAGTPEPAIKKLNTALTEIFAEQETKDRLAAQYITGIASTSADANAYFRKEIATSKKIIEGMGMKPE
jgi:tripartite-type tricarboxylate transporter receptor subunit TctC